MEKELVYIADPMCSWCWGFSPVIQGLREQFGARLPIRLVMGGLRPGGAAEKMGFRLAGFLRQEWEHISGRTGQPFDFTTLEKTDFLYDTEPAARAVMVLRSMLPGRDLDMLARVQESFYARALDVTREEVLGNLAASLGADKEEFLARFRSDAARQAIWMEFDDARHLGVAAFPTTLLRIDDQLFPLSRGYRPLDELAPRVEAFLEETP